MNNKVNFERELSLIQFFTKDFFEPSNVIEIRFLKVLKKKKLGLIKRYSPLILYFLSNDDVGNNFFEVNDSIDIYSVKTKSDNRIFLVAILIETNPNGTKKQELIYLKKINSLIFNLLTSKYDSIFSP